MTRSEFVLFVQTIEAFYPKARLFKDSTEMELWFRNLSDLPYPLVSTAIIKWGRTQKFSPSISEIRKGATAIRHWILCQQIIRKSLGQPYFLPDELVSEKRLLDECQKYLSECT